MAERDFKKFAAEKLAGIYKVQDYDRVLAVLRQADPAFQSVAPEKFGLEFLGLRLALACHAWARSCRENRVTDEKIENLFFKTVMQSFQSSKFLGIAAVFSEYLHAPESEDQALLPVTALMMRRLGLAEQLGTAQKPVLSPGFRIVVETAEGLKSAFENEFFEFCFSPS